MFFYLFSLLLVCFVWYTRWWWRVVNYSTHVPTLPGALPIIGHGHKLLGLDGRGIFQFMDSVSREALKRGGLLKFWLGPLPFFIITDVEDVQTITNACFGKNYLYQFASAWLGNGLVTAREPEFWRNHRRILNPAFNQTIIVGFLPIFNRESRRFVETLSLKLGAGPFEFGPMVELSSLEIICQTAFGLPPNTESIVSKEYSDAVKDILEIMIKRFQNICMHFDSLYRLSGTKKKEAGVVKILHEMSSDILKRAQFDTKREPEATEHDSTISRRLKGFLDILLEQNNIGSLSNDDVREELDTTIMAGHHTSATTLIFTIILLGSHPQVQEKLYNELLEIMGKSDRDVTKDDIPKLVYLDAVLKEAMRLYPVIALIMREMDRDVKLKNYIIPSGATVIASFWGLNRNGVWGPDVEEFRPERWFDSDLPENPAFGSWSYGRRNCIGKPHALMSLKVSLIHIFRRFKISANKDDMTLKWEVLLKPACKMYICIENRHE